MQWSVTPTFEGANHHPKVSVSGRLDRSARRGEVVTLKANATDPDGDALTYKWWQYQEAGTYPGQVTFSSTSSARSSVRVPADAARGQTIHAILEVTDSGDPALTSYQRVVITVGRTRR